ncbi:tigger transposable element derived 5-like [Lineus longissimus]|uniref:tigger transposable element derived 5-like n=1 Tax=Lineus longissimus TaxID=88925 RepID=UPI00315DCA0F
MMCTVIFCILIMFSDFVHPMDNGDINNVDENVDALQPPARRHRSYSLAEKIRLLDDYENENIRQPHGISSAQFAREHNIPSGTMRRWLREEDDLRERHRETTSRQVNRRRQRQRGIALWPEVDRSVREWMATRRQHGVPVSGDDMMIKAEQSFRTWWAVLPEQQQQEYRQHRPQLTDFRASRGWLTGFLSRNGIRFRKQCKNVTAIPENADELVANFQQNVAQTVDENGIELVINMNETFALFDMAPQYTYNEKGAKQIDLRTSRGNPKLGCTVTLGITREGRNLPASVILRGLRADGEVIQDLRENAPDNVRVTGSETGWANWQTLLS